MADIPKIIHLCWLSGDAYPPLVADCIDSWKEVLPDYQIMLWDSNKYNAEIDNKFAQEAYSMRKWAFVADYIRLYALYNYGGIYLDSDVTVFKSFDKFLKHDFFSGIELFEKINHIAIEAAVMGAKPGHLYIKECLQFYENSSFITVSGEIDQCIMPKKIAAIAHEKWGFEYKPEYQELQDGMVIYGPLTFANPSIVLSKENTYAQHMWSGSWWRKSSWFKRARQQVNRDYSRLVRR